MILKLFQLIFKGLFIKKLQKIVYLKALPRPLFNFSKYPKTANVSMNLLFNKTIFKAIKKNVLKI